MIEVDFFALFLVNNFFFTTFSSSNQLFKCIFSSNSFCNRKTTKDLFKETIDDLFAKLFGRLKTSEHVETRWKLRL